MGRESPRTHVHGLGQLCIRLQPLTNAAVSVECGLAVGMHCGTNGQQNAGQSCKPSSRAPGLLTRRQLGFQGVDPSHRSG